MDLNLRFECGARFTTQFMKSLKMKWHGVPWTTQNLEIPVVFWGQPWLCLRLVLTTRFRKNWQISSISPNQPSYLTFSSGLGEKVVCVCTWGGRRDATAYHTQHGTGSLADCTCTRREQLRAWGQNVLQLSEPIWLKLTVRIFIYVIHNRESLLRYRYIPGPPKRTTPLSPYSQHKHGCWRPRKNPYIFGFLMESM